MSKKRKAESQVSKSPAEFFAENQAIAGFDNLGKSLYTTIRELVENGLDACEALNVLPEISVDIREYTQSHFNELQMSDVQLDRSQQVSNSIAGPPEDAIDPELFEKKSSKKAKKSGDSDPSSDIPSPEAAPSKKGAAIKTTQYFMITVNDNGCGLAHDAIPTSFGRVLSGSKYGVRQTRGKFGLGAKMALIWAKKSTGHPIHVLTAHRNADEDPPSSITSCILDIDVYKNEPKVLFHEKMKNKEDMIGTTVRVLIAGNWTTYKARIVQYLQQLAIITPYAAIHMKFAEESGKRNMQISYERRSDQMPPAPQTVKHHPSSVNNIIVQQLIRLTKTKTIVSFLSKELSSVSTALAKRLVAELVVVKVAESTKPSDLTDKQITRLVQLFRKVQLFRPPSGACLSPLGEYNLNLGIHKVLEPDLIATYRDKPSAFEGHPFLIEAAVSLGGQNAREGITVYRFANRIPLLFEGGADVATRVALTKIRWSNYKIDYKRDKVGVFVSIVSTKIPFKGTSKEYIGDDATEIHQSVKKALQLCCQQLRSHLSKRSALKDAMTRKSRITKYVPDVGRSLFGLLEGMRQRHANDSPTTDSPGEVAAWLEANKQVDEATIRQCLTEAIDDDIPMIQESKDQGEQLAADAKAAVPLYIVPLFGMEKATENDIVDDLFTFRPILPPKVTLRDPS